MVLCKRHSPLDVDWAKTQEFSKSIRFAKKGRTPTLKSVCKQTGMSSLCNTQTIHDMLQETRFLCWKSRAFYRPKSYIMKESLFCRLLTADGGLHCLLRSPEEEERRVWFKVHSSRSKCFLFRVTLLNLCGVVSSSRRSAARLEKTLFCCVFSKEEALHLAWWACVSTFKNIISVWCHCKGSLSYWINGTKNVMHQSDFPAKSRSFKKKE